MDRRTRRTSKTTTYRGRREIRYESAYLYAQGRSEVPTTKYYGKVHRITNDGQSPLLDL